MRSEVVIIGAGVSGLACAAALAKHAIRAVIVDARPVVGGRIRTVLPADGGPPLELGAQVVHGDRNPVLDLAGHGLPGIRSPAAAPLPRATAAWAVLRGRRVPLGALARGGIPPWAIEPMLTAGDPELPVSEWLDQRRIAGDHRLAAEEWFRQNWAAEPAQLSAAGVAAARRADATGDGEHAFDAGFGALAEALAAGADIRLRTPVRALRWTPGRAEVTTGAGQRLVARAAVITVPPPVVTAGRLAIAPLPPGKAAAARALPSGDGLCAIATMARAVPESAVVFDADGRGGFVRCAAGRPEVLIVAKARAAAAVRGAGPAGVLARVLPARLAGQVTGIRIADWGSDPWASGVFSYPAPGAARAGAAWAAPLGRTLFFAGEATTAGTLPPTVHGALSSGLRAASEVVEAWGR